MFHTTVNDVNLFGGRTAAGPKPSFHPAVEALEERVLLRFVLGSIDFANGQPIRPENAAGPELANGQRTFPNKSPALEWHNAPPGTVSFGLIMYDASVTLPPSEGGGNFIHWVIFNIPASTRALPEGIHPRSNPFGAHQGVNGNDEFGYLGPNPQPAGSIHTYVFRLYALNTELTLRGRVTAGELRSAMNPPGGPDHILGRAVLEGTFQLLLPES
jgi:Raf kinase inhibitor-like YbhB/YbcL family protein